MDRTRAGLAALPTVASLSALAVAALALAGWALETPVLYRLHPRLVSMNPMTAVAIILSAVALLALRRRGAGAVRRQAGIAAASLYATIGGLRLVEAATGSPNVDLWLFHQKVTGETGRMVPSTASCLVLL